jgi:methionyl-tRNA formyltransferase
MGIITSKGLLVVHKLQLEGKKPVEAKEFLNGYRDIIGNTLQ